MYTSYLKKAESKNGFGIFTSVVIPPGVPVCEFRGTLYHSPLPSHITDSQVLQVGPNTYLGPSGGIDDYINHSCNPNCSTHIVGNRAILYSLYVIPAGAELTFDYSTSSTDTPDTWQMKCNCGAPNCRKLISGYQSLDVATLQKYKNQGFLPLYITNPEMVLPHD